MHQEHRAAFALLHHVDPSTVDLDVGAVLGKLRRQPVGNHNTDLTPSAKAQATVG